MQILLLMLGCVSQHRSIADAQWVKIKRFDGGSVPEWVIDVPRDYAIDAVGSIGVVECEARVRNGWLGCMTRITPTIQLRGMFVGGQLNWALELSSGLSTSAEVDPRTWYFGRASGEAPNMTLETVEL